MDGQSLSPISQIGACEAGFIQYLPSALVYRLSANPKDLIVEPWGGLDVLTALHHRSALVVAVVSNPLLIDAVARFGRGIGVQMHPYLLATRSRTTQDTDPEPMQSALMPASPS